MRDIPAFYLLLINKTVTHIISRYSHWRDWSMYLIHLTKEEDENRVIHWSGILSKADCLNQHTVSTEDLFDLFLSAFWVSERIPLSLWDLICESGEKKNSTFISQHIFGFRVAILTALYLNEYYDLHTRLCCGVGLLLKFPF